MLVALSVPLLAALFFLIPNRGARSWWTVDTISKWAFVVPLGLFSYFLSQPLDLVDTTGLVTQEGQLLPINFTLQWDGLGKLFALLITGIGTLIFLYAGAYMKGQPYRMRLFGFLMLFMGAMLGVVLSDNLLLLFVFWELTSISSFFLIGFKSGDAGSRKSALRALTVTGTGGLVMLGGFILMGEIAGTYQISELILQRADLLASPYLPIILILLFLGAFTKSAQFPFHFWLPGAMKAPTPVSAYLHSATMVKAGVYLLARMSPVFQSDPIWHHTLTIIGCVTMLYAAFHAIWRTDLKAILAYSTVAALGMLVFLIGLGTTESLIAASMFILVHALYKASLFLTAGVIDHETGTRDITALGGLRKVMGPLALAGILAAVSNAGIPPSLGFVGKDLIYEGTLHLQEGAWWWTTAAWITNVLLLIAGFMAGWSAFSGSLPKQFESLHLPARAMWVPPLLLAVLGLGFGLVPGYVGTWLIEDVYYSMKGSIFEGKLALWHGFNIVLYLSLGTIGVGLLVYKWHQPTLLFGKIRSSLEGISPESVGSKLILGVELLAKEWTRLFQNGYLRYYLLMIIASWVLLMGYKLWMNGQFHLDIHQLTEITIYEAIAVLVLWLGLLFAILSRSRLIAVAAMGVVGYAICIIFVFYSAPDLAMTQFTIDTLTVILFVLVLYKLPKFIPLKFNAYHLRDILVSLGVGVLITLLTLEVLQTSPERNISEFYASNAYTLAKGKNIVNVILVDFRGADTMIEIVVLSIAAIGVFSLLKLRVKPNQKVE